MLVVPYHGSEDTMGGKHDLMPWGQRPPWRWVQGWIERMLVVPNHGSEDTMGGEKAGVAQPWVQLRLDPMVGGGLMPWGLRPPWRWALG